MRLLSLRTRIFTARVFLVLVASLLIAGVTSFQYREQSNTYHEQRLERKENQLKKRISYLFEESCVEVTPDNIAAIFSGHIQQTSDVLNINFRVYSLEGKLLSSGQVMEPLPIQTLSEEVLHQLAQRPDVRYIDVRSEEGIRTRSSYFYIFDQNEVPLAIS